jgi:hypothetical protein
MLTNEAMKAKNWPTQLDRLDVFKSSKKLKSLIREGGIPLTWRRHAWLEPSGTDCGEFVSSWPRSRISFLSYITFKFFNLRFR